LGNGQSGKPATFWAGVCLTRLAAWWLDVVVAGLWSGLCRWLVGAVSLVWMVRVCGGTARRWAGMRRLGGGC
jgi:hypothetical protein